MKDPLRHGASHHAGVFVLIALLVAGTAWAFWPCLDAGFHIVDDKYYIKSNPMVQNGLSWLGVKWAFTTLYLANWHPLTWISHQLDCSWFGLDPQAHHAVNLVLHMINTLLLSFLATRWLKSLVAGVVVGGFFAWHPLHVESVVWISERKDLLSALFFMLTLICYDRYVSKQSRRYLGLAMGAFFLGLMAKPMLVSLPVVLILLDYWPYGRWTWAPHRVWRERSMIYQRLRRHPLLIEKVPFILLAILSSFITYVAQALGGSVRTTEHLELIDRVQNVIRSYGQYLWKTIWPKDLCSFYVFPEHVPVLESLGLLLFLGVVTAFVMLRADRWPAIFVGWMWFGVTLLPVIGLIQVGDQAMANRYTYIPLIGLFVGIASSVQASGRARLWLGALGFLALIAFMPITRARCVMWQDPLNLVRHDLEVQGDFHYFHRQLGSILRKRGAFDSSERHYRQSLELKYEAITHFELAQLLRDRGELEMAFHEFEVLAQRNTDKTYRAMALGQMASIRSQQGKGDEERALWGRSIEMDPFYLTGLYHFGLVSFTSGRMQDAKTVLEWYLAVRQQQPLILMIQSGHVDASAEVYYLLGRTYLNLGSKDQAQAAFRMSLSRPARINPAAHEHSKQLLLGLAESP